LDELGRFAERVLAIAEPAPAISNRILELAGTRPPDLAHETIGTYLDSARLLGRRTAEMHAALGSPTDDPAFAPEVFTTLYQRSLYQSLRSSVGQTLRLLRTQAERIPEASQLLEFDEEI